MHFYNVEVAKKMQTQELIIVVCRSFEYYIHQISQYSQLQNFVWYNLSAKTTSCKNKKLNAQKTCHWLKIVLKDLNCVSLTSFVPTLNYLPVNDEK